MESEPITKIQPTTHRKLKLPNGLPLTKDRNKKINLEQLYQQLQGEKQYLAEYDKHTNKYQNYIKITIKGSNIIQGQFRIFSNGTITTNIGLTEQVLIRFFDAFYYIYVRDTLETI